MRDELPQEALAFRPFTGPFLERFFDDATRGDFPVRSHIVRNGPHPFL